MDVEAGAGASWSGTSWEPVGAPTRHHEIEVLAVESALRRSYPALTRALGPAGVETLARELVLAHPFFPGSDADLTEILHVFLGAALEDDPERGAWLAELALLEEAFEAVRRARPQAHGDELAGGQLLSFEHRVDELHAALLAGGEWQAPSPQPVLLAVVGGSAGPRSIELAREQWTRAQVAPLEHRPRTSPGPGRKDPSSRPAA